MANRIKEDEKNERIIRGLLKLPANRKCINCNSLGPQYVCTTFSIFICTNCSGIHREFTHRVKSVSMAKFTSQEVSNLQEGGNECAREVFFKEWDAQRHSFPDSSNVEKLRTFIKHVYVDRKYTGDKPVDKPPRVKGDREDYEHRKPDIGSRSPPYNDRPGIGGRNDDRNFRYNYDERRSPGYDQGDYRRSPSYFEVVDDRRRDDKFGNNVNQNRRSEDRRLPDGTQKPEGSSPSHQKSGSTPAVHPVKEILGDDAPALLVGEASKSNGVQVGGSPKSSVVRVIEGPPTAQAAPTSSSGSIAAVNPTEQKPASTVSLIDFDADPGPSVDSVPEQSVPPQTSPSANEANWASFDSVTVPKAQQAATNLNSLDSVLSQLSDSGSSTSNIPFTSNIGTDSSPLTTSGQLPNVHQMEPPLSSQASNQPAVPPFTPSLVGGPTDQLRIPSVAPNVLGSLAALHGQTTQAYHAPNVESNAAVSLQPNAEARPSGRKELPVDLFAATYPTSHPSMMGWHARPNFGLGFPMQYPPQVAPSFSYASKSANPFDVSSEPTLAHASTFPSLASLQGALPNPPNSDILRSVSFGATPFSQQQFPQNQSSPLLTSVPGGYMGQQFQSIPGQQFQGNIRGQFQSNIPAQPFHNNIPGQTFQSGILQQMPNIFPMGHQGPGSVPNQMSAFGATTGMTTGFSQPGPLNDFRQAGGNPFG